MEEKTITEITELKKVLRSFFDDKSTNRFNSRLIQDIEILKSKKQSKTQSKTLTKTDINKLVNSIFSNFSKIIKKEIVEVILKTENQNKS